MPRWKAILKRLLFPGGGWAALAVLLGGGSLAATFLWLGEDHPFAYLSYLLSFYALTVFIAAAAAGAGKLRRAVHRVPLARRYLTDRYFQVRASLILSFSVNLCYAGFKLGCAVWYASFWDGALAFYNLLLCGVRALLIRQVPGGEGETDLPRELRCCRAAGLLLIALDAALGVIALQIVRDGYGYDYPGTLIYLAALHAFYSLTLAVVNAIKFRKYRSPVLSAAKAVNLTTALVSLFSLETAMLARFGGEDRQFRLVMTACTAVSVCLLVLGVAVFMTAYGNRKKGRDLHGPYPGGGG